MHKTIKCKYKQSTIEQQKTFPQKTGRQLFKNKNSKKNTIQNTLKIRQKQFYSHPSGLVYSLMKIYNCKNKYQLSLFDPRDKIVL